jgi:hypothetical protein
MHNQHGSTQLICRTRLSGLDHRKVLRSLELIKGHVLPYFHREGAMQKSF